MRVFLYFIFLSSLLYSCAPSASEKYNTASNEAEILSLLNERDYGKAIWLIESQYTKDPKKAEIKFYLGQAYLGRSGFEPLEFVEKIYADQNKVNDPLGKIFFSRCRTSSIAPGEKVPLPCVLKRIFLHSPQVDVGDFARARTLLRAAYPNPVTTSSWSNTLIGIVELVSVIKRTGNIYLYAKDYIENEEMRKKFLDIQWIKTQLISTTKEARECAIRGLYSGDKISKFILKLKTDSIYDPIDNKFQFSSHFGNFKLLELASHLSDSNQISADELKANLKHILEEEEGRLN